MSFSLRWILAATALCVGFGFAFRAALRLDRERPLHRVGPQLHVVSVTRDPSSSSIDVDAQVVNAGSTPLSYHAPGVTPILGLESFDGIRWVDSDSYGFCGNGWSTVEIEPGEVVETSGWSFSPAPRMRARVTLEQPDGSSLVLTSDPFELSAALGGVGLHRRIGSTLSTGELRGRSKPARW